MHIHPIQESPRRWMSALCLSVVAAGIQAMLLMIYAGAERLPAVVDGLLSMGLLCAFAYLAWYVIDFVSMIQTNIVLGSVAISCWLAGCFVAQYFVEQTTAQCYAPFYHTFPFRLIFGVQAWALIILWYKLHLINAARKAEEEDREEQAEAFVGDASFVSDASMDAEAKVIAEPGSSEPIDRITVKDGTRIHLIKTDELIYIQACGDYVTLITPAGQFVKEQTMKYLEAHLPSTSFVRIHRSTIVNVTQISRVELFGKENYQLLLKSGVKLRVSNSGYRLLKERLDL